MSPSAQARTPKEEYRQRCHSGLRQSHSCDNIWEFQPRGCTSVATSTHPDNLARFQFERDHLGLLPVDLGCHVKIQRLGESEVIVGDGWGCAIRDICLGELSLPPPSPAAFAATTSCGAYTRNDGSSGLWLTLLLCSRKLLLHLARREGVLAPDHGKGSRNNSASSSS